MCWNIPRVDAGDDLADRERRPGGVARGDTGNRHAGRRVIDRLVLVDLLGVGRDVVEDVRRVARDRRGRAVGERRSRGELGRRRAARGERRGRRVRVGLGGVRAEVGDPGRRERVHRSVFCSYGVSVAVFTVGGAVAEGAPRLVSVKVLVTGPVGSEVARRGVHRGHQRPRRGSRILAVELVVRGVADRAPAQRHRVAGGHRDRRRRGRRLAAGRRVLVGDRIRVAAGGGERAAGGVDDRIVKLGRVDGSRSARHEVGQARVLAGDERAGIVAAERRVRIGAGRQAEPPVPPLPA